MRISDWSSDVCSSDLLSGCIFGGGHTPPADQRRAAASGPSARQTQMCHADLKRIGVAFNPLPNRDRGGGCSTIGTVQLLDIGVPRSEEHTSELQSLMRISYAVFCLKKTKTQTRKS